MKNTNIILYYDQNANFYVQKCIKICNKNHEDIYNFFLQVYYGIRYIRIIGILSLTDTVVTRQDVKVIKIIYKKDQL